MTAGSSFARSHSYSSTTTSPWCSRSIGRFSVFGGVSTISTLRPWAAEVRGRGVTSCGGDEHPFRSGGLLRLALAQSTRPFPGDARARQLPDRPPRRPRSRTHRRHPRRLPRQARPSRPARQALGRHRHRRGGLARRRRPAHLGPVRDDLPGAGDPRRRALARRRRHGHLDDLLDGHARRTASRRSSAARWTPRSTGSWIAIVVLGALSASAARASRPPCSSGRASPAAATPCSARSAPCSASSPPSSSRGASPAASCASTSR